MENRNALVQDVKSRIEKIIETNKKAYGKDYSTQVGTVLEYLVEIGRSKVDATIGAIMIVGKLEEKIEEETGKRPYFHHLPICGWAIHKLYMERNNEALDELRRYANGLIERSIHPKNG
jgi:hypothetical protein